MKSSSWSIGDLAARFGLPTHVLRHWEQRGLLTPGRDSAGRRRYREPDAYRVAVIVASRAAGMGLDQIRALMDAGERGREEILGAHLADIDERIAALVRSREMARHALECEAHDISTCPGFRASVTDIVAGVRTGLGLPPAPHSHPAGTRDG